MTQECRKSIVGMVGDSSHAHLLKYTFVVPGIAYDGWLTRLDLVNLQSKFGQPQQVTGVFLGTFLAAYLEHGLLFLISTGDQEGYKIYCLFECRGVIIIRNLSAVGCHCFTFIRECY